MILKQKEFLCLFYSMGLLQYCMKEKERKSRLAWFLLIDIHYRNHFKNESMTD